MRGSASRWRNRFAFLREPQRVLAVCLTVALGTVALLCADGFIDRTFFLFREDIIHAHFGHLQVVPQRPGELLDTGSGADDVRGVVERVLASRAGTVVAARRSFAGLVAFGERTVSFVGEGVEPKNERALSKALRLSAGAPLGSGGSVPEVLLGEGLARSIGAHVGDRVTLLATVPGGGISGIEATVAGLFYTATKAYDDRALRVPLPVAERLTQQPGASRLMVLLPDTDEAAPAAAALRAALRDRPVSVRLWSDLADFYNKTVDLFRRQLGFVRAVVLAIVILATANSMARNVLEQQREIGTMMALGARRAAVARKFVFEAIVMGLVGGLVGLLAGAVVAAVVTRIGIPMPPPPGNAHGFTGGISFSTDIATSALVSVVAACALASLLPALRASRVRIVDALRAEK